MRTFAEKPKAIHQNTPAKSTKPRRGYFGHSHEVNPILHLQRTIGNQAVQRLLESNTDELQTRSSTTAPMLLGHDFSRIPVQTNAYTTIQPKLKVNTPGDKYEQEADRFADQVMRTPEPRLQRACAGGGTHPNRIATGFSSTPNILVQGRFRPPGDDMHRPLLDQYSRDTGLPRDTVTQHDPGYEQWLRDRAAIRARQSINITLDMPLLATPAPDHSRDENQLGAWEKAIFRFTPRLSFRCDHVIVNGVESSFVTDIGIQLTQATFQYFIARHVYENSRGIGVSREARAKWLIIYRRIARHAREHFTRYRRVVDSTRRTIMQQFENLPTRNSPAQIPQRLLEAYLNQLFQYLVARLNYELWRTTCDWEHEDYPNLFRGIPSVSGRLVPACDPRPAVPPVPIMPMAVTSGSPPAGPSTRRTGPSQQQIGQ